MTYKRYIELGFIRVDMNDGVEHDSTGYFGFYLTKNKGKNLTVVAYAGELDSPKMCITKRESCEAHYIKITPEMVEDLFQK